MITLHPDEKIILEKRVFWLPITAQGVLSAVAGIAPLLMLWLFKGLLPQPFAEFVNVYALHSYFLAIAWALIAWILFAIRWTDYYLDVLLVTTRRVVDIEQRGLFGRDVSETRLENIQDIRVEIMGPLASILNFGNLHIQTAAASKEFLIRNLGNPNAVKDIITRQYELSKSAPAGSVISPPPSHPTN